MSSVEDNIEAAGFSVFAETLRASPYGETLDGGGKDVFVHMSAVERSGMKGLADGQKVSFDLERDRQGRDSATNLKPV